MKLETGYNFITKFNDKSFEGSAPYVTVALIWGIGGF